MKIRSCLLKNTKRKYSLHQFSTKLRHAELVKTRALFAGSAYLMIIVLNIPLRLDYGGLGLIW